MRCDEARELLARMGVRPLSAADMSEVSSTVDALLEEYLPRTDVGTPLGDLLDIEIFEHWLEPA